MDADQAANLKKIARREGLYLLGPNSLGFQRPHLQLNASAAGPLASDGPLALVCQSGALTSSILDWASNNAVGFSAVVSLGPNTDVDIAQVLDFLAHDARTQSIVVYMEGISNARRFMSALRSAANAKPVVVLKAGRKPAGNEAAQTHSGTIVGSDDVFDAALRRAGAVRVRSFVELFSAAKCLASRYRPVGKRLAIVTNGGGPGVLAADWVNEILLNLGKLSPESVRALTPQLPPLASLSDLIDLSEDAGAEHFRLAIEAASKDRQVDGFWPSIRPRWVRTRAPWPPRWPMSKAHEQAAAGLLDGRCLGGASARHPARGSIPSFRTPEAAVGAFGNIASFYQNQQLLQQTPPPLSTLAKPDIEGARLVIESVLAERRKVLTEMESKTLLAAFHIPVTKTILARNAHEAMMIATQMGFPVALKIDSPDISHKSDVGGVALNIHSGTAARDAYTDMVQRVARLQPQARINGVTVQNMAAPGEGANLHRPRHRRSVWPGHHLWCGRHHDRADRRPRHGTAAAEPVSGAPADRTFPRGRDTGRVARRQRGRRDALEQVLLRVSEMVCALPQLREMDINPLIVDEQGAVAVDARIAIDQAANTSGGRADNFSHLAILPYPARYEQLWPMRGGGEYLVRPIHPDDAQMLQQLCRTCRPKAGISVSSRPWWSCPPLCWRALR
jgi:Acyl-CoA synthetase (NDP forming)